MKLVVIYRRHIASVIAFLSDNDHAGYDAKNQ